MNVNNAYKYILAISAFIASIALFRYADSADSHRYFYDQERAVIIDLCSGEVEDVGYRIREAKDISSKAYERRERIRNEANQ